MTEDIEGRNPGRRMALGHQAVCIATECQSAGTGGGGLCHSHYDRMKECVGKALGNGGRVDPRKLSEDRIEQALRGFLGEFGEAVCCPRSPWRGTATRREVFVRCVQHSGQWTERHEVILLTHSEGKQQERIEQMAATISAQAERIAELERIIDSLQSGHETDPNGWDHDSNYAYSHTGFLRARREAFERSEGVCQGCGFEDAKDGHHWERPGEYTAPSELEGRHLTALCRECHALITAARQRKGIGPN